MQGFDFPTLGALLFVASLVAMATRRLDLPYSVGLVAAGHRAGVAGARHRAAADARS